MVKQSSARQPNNKLVLIFSLFVVVFGIFLLSSLHFLDIWDTDGADRSADENGSFMAVAGSQSNGDFPVDGDKSAMHPGKAELSGTVFAEGEKFSKGASICARCITGACMHELERVRCVRSDDLGVFRIEGLVQGRYWLNVAADKFRQTRNEHNNAYWLEDAQKIDGIELSLEIGGGWVRGRVVNEADQAIPDVQIFRRDELDTDRVERTEAEGNFKIWLGEETALFFDAPGYARGVDFFTPPLDDIEIILLPGGAVRGKVVDQEGNPVKRVDLRFFYRGLRSHVAHIHARTEDDGSFHVKGLTYGKYEISVRSGDWYREEPGKIIVNADEVSDPVEIRVRRGSRVTGVVFKADEKIPCPEAVVSLRKGNDSGKLVVADSFGRVVFEGIKPGIYEVDAKCENLAAVHPLPIITVGEIESGQEYQGQEYQWFVEGGSELSGKVVDHRGRPARGVEVIHKAINGSQVWGGVVRTDDSGSFKLKGLPSTKFRLYPRGKFKELGKPVETDVPANEEIVLTLPSSGLIEVTIVDHAGRPVKDAEIRSSPLTWPAGALLFTDFEGRQRFGAKPGALTLRTAYPGLLHIDKSVVERTVEVQAGIEVQVKIELPNHTALMSGVVVDAEGLPVAGARLSPWPADNDLSHTTYTVFFSDSEGRFTIDRLPRGKYAIYAIGPDGGENEIRSSAPSDNLRIKLSKPGGLDVIVSLEDGAVAENFDIEAIRTGSKGIRKYRGFNGISAIRDLSPGTWRLTVRADEYIGKKNAKVQSGENTTVSIVLERGGVVTGRLIDGKSGQPIVDQCVYLHGDQVLSLTRPDSDGRIKFEAVQPGRYSIKVMGLDDNHEFFGSPFEVPPGGLDVGDMILSNISQSAEDVDD